MNEGIVLRAYGRTVQFAAPEELREQVLKRLPPAYQPAAGRAERTWTVHQRASVWRALVDGMELAAVEDKIVATEMALSDLELWIAERARRRVFVHAGCVVHDNRAILLPGWSMSGKTNLTTALVRAGAAYYSDEYAVLDSQGLVRPYPRPPAVRANFWEAARRIPLDELGGPVGHGAAQVGLVAVLRYDATSRWAVDPLSRSKAILQLMAHTVPAQYAPRRSLTALENATANAIAVSGTRGETDDAAARLLDMLSAQAQ